MMRKTAGVFLVKNDGTILVGHPTNHNINFFSIPKGGVDEGESLIEAAIRETYEEANVDICDFKTIHTLSPRIHKNGKKILYPYVLFEGENDYIFDEFELRCNSNVPVKDGGFPEMDSFKFLSFDEARIYLHPTQIDCIDEIEKRFNKQIKKKNE